MFPGKADCLFDFSVTLPFNLHSPDKKPYIMLINLSVFQTVYIKTHNAHFYSRQYFQN